MNTTFRRIAFSFVIDYIDITNDLDKIIKSEEIEGNLETMNKKKILHFKKDEDKIEIDMGQTKFSIDLEPACILNENNQCLFKIYNSLDTYYINEIEDLIKFDYDCYLTNGTKISFSEAIKKKEKKIFLKNKINQYNDIFKPLCKRLPKSGEKIDITLDYFLPEKSESLFKDYDKKFELLIDQRIFLINKIIEFICNNKKMILKIYGTDGIGKSVSLLYFMNIRTTYKILYLNLKDVFKYNSNPSTYFKNALMKYYSSNIYPSNKNENIENNEANLDKFNYNIYLEEIKNLEEEHKGLFSNRDLWDMLSAFCDFIKILKNSVIIIDQYKSDYDKKGFLKTLIKKYSDRKNIRFILALSINDNTVKEDFLTDLMMIFKDKLESLKLSKETTQKEIEDEIFKNFKFKNIKKIKEFDTDFSKISIFNPENNDNSNKLVNNEIESKDIDLNINKNINYIKDSTDIIRSELTEIIYINNLISMQNIIKDSDKEFYKLFNFNPKAFTKFCHFSKLNVALKPDILHLTFLDMKFNGINEKIDLFYKNLSKRAFIKYSAECLKGTFLLKLIDIIKNKKELDLKELFNID